MKVPFSPTALLHAFHSSADAPLSLPTTDLARLMQSLPVSSWDWNADRYGAWVEWVSHRQLYRLEIHYDPTTPALPGYPAHPSDVALAGIAALHQILEALSHLHALAQLPFASWDQWTLAFQTDTTRRSPDPCFLALGFSERPLSATVVRERYRQLSKQTHPDSPQGDATQFRHIKEAFDQALVILQREGFEDPVASA